MNHYHYTYIVEGMGKRYIGVRTSKCHPTKDSKYFGSCRTLNKAIKEHGKDKFTKNILAIFGTRKHAAEHEIKLHDHFDVGRNPEYWNRAKHTSTGFSIAGTCHSLETRRKMSISSNGTKHTEESKRKMSLVKQGKNNPMYGKTVSEESKFKMSETKIGFR